MEENRLDEKFVDEAWSAMKGLLDQEMPVKKRKPIWPLFFIFLVGLLGLLVIGAYTHTFSTLFSQQATNLHEVKAFPIPRYGKERAGETTISKDVNSTVDASKKPEALTNNTFSSKSTSTIKTSTLAIPEVQKSKKRFNSNSFLPDRPNRLTPIPFNPLPIKVIDKIPFHYSTPLLNNPIEFNQKEPIAQIEGLPILTPGLLTHDSEALYEPLIHKTNRAKWHWGLGLGTLFETNFDYSGHALQLNLTKTFKKKPNWALGWHLGYHYRNIDQSLTLVAAQEAENLDSSGNVPTTDFTSRAAQGGIDTSSILRTHHLTLGIGVSRRIKGGLSLGAGLEGAYLLTHGWGPALSDELDASFSTSGRTVYSQLGPEQLEFNQVDLAFMTTLNYAFSPKWKAFAEYRHGFVNQFSSEENKAYRRYFNVGLSWRFR